MAERQWFYAAGPNRQGPIGQGAVLELIRDKGIDRATMVWTEGMAQWQPAGSVAELAGHFGAAPPPLPAATVPLGYALPSAGGDIGQDAGIRLLLPVGRSGWAIAAGYLGLFSVLAVPAPFAVITGIIAIVHIRRDSKLHGMGRALFGVIMGGAVLAFLAIALIVSLVNKH